MSHTIVIRRARPDDEATLMALARRLATFSLPAWRTAAEIADADGQAMAAAARAARPDDEVFVAEDGAVPVGCLHVLATTDFFGRPHAHVSVVATSEAAEGHGVGRALMGHAEEWARRRGLTLLTLNVFEANARARQFYERGGFTPEIVKYAKVL